MSRTFWTTEERQMLRECYASVPNPVLAHRLGRTCASIFTAARRMGLVKVEIDSDNRGRPGVLRDPLLAAIAACADPLGATFDAILAATGRDRRNVSSGLTHAKSVGAVFRLGSGKDLRYFATAERMEECRPAVEAFFAALKLARNISARQKDVERNRQKRVRDAALNPKPPKVAKPKPEPKKRHRQKALTVMKPRGPVPVMLNRGPKPKAPVRDLPVVIPAHVRVQVCPCGVDSRYTAPDGHIGEFTKQWRELRKGAR